MYYTVFVNDGNFTLDQNSLNIGIRIFISEEQWKEKLENQSVLQKVRVNCSLSEVLLEGVLERSLYIKVVGYLKNDSLWSVH